MWLHCLVMAIPEVPVAIVKQGPCASLRENFKWPQSSCQHPHLLVECQKFSHMTARILRICHKFLSFSAITPNDWLIDCWKSCCYLRTTCTLLFKDLTWWKVVFILVSSFKQTIMIYHCFFSKWNQKFLISFSYTSQNVWA